MRRAKLKSLILPIIYFAIALNAFGISYWIKNVNEYKTEIEDLTQKLHRLKQKKLALDKRFESWKEKLADTPVTQVREIEKVLPIATAVIRDRALVHGVALNNLRIGGSRAVLDGDIRANMATPYGTEEQLMAVDVEALVSWTSIDGFMDWLDEVQKVPSVIVRVVLSNTNAIVTFKVLGK